VEVIIEFMSIAILTLKTDGTCLSATCHSDRSGAKLITGALNVELMIQAIS
jgi:hypothetical protein